MLRLTHCLEEILTFLLFGLSFALSQFVELPDRHWPVKESLCFFEIYTSTV